jgi:hypothetical protein
MNQYVQFFRFVDLTLLFPGILFGTLIATTQNRFWEKARQTQGTTVVFAIPFFIHLRGRL